MSAHVGTTRPNSLLSSVKTHTQLAWLRDRIGLLLSNNPEDPNMHWQNDIQESMLSDIQIKVEALCSKKLQERDKLKTLLAHRELQAAKAQSAVVQAKKHQKLLVSLQEKLEGITSKWLNLREQNMQIMQKLRENREVAQQASIAKIAKVRAIKSKSIDVVKADANLGQLCSRYTDLLNMETDQPQTRHRASTPERFQPEEEQPRRLRPSQTPKSPPPEPDRIKLADLQAELTNLRTSNSILEAGVFEEGEIEAAQQILRKLNRRIQYRIDRCPVRPAAPTNTNADTSPHQHHQQRQQIVQH